MGVLVAISLTRSDAASLSVVRRASCNILLLVRFILQLTMFQNLLVGIVLAILECVIDCARVIVLFDF